MKKETLKLIMIIVGIALALFLIIVPDKVLMFGIGLGALFVSSFIIYFIFKPGKTILAAPFVAYFTVFIILIYYITPSLAVSVSSGPILDDNWWNALNWIKNNTAECSTIATYWDPGHFITAIAKRPVIFDGASQNAMRTLTNPGYPDGITLERYDHGIVQVIDAKTGNITRARIKDVTIAMMTDNESLALKILGDYRRPGCNETYFLATSDLIYKSQWWTYFATWDPTKNCQGDLCKGKMSVYGVTQLARRKPLLGLDIVGYEYPLGPQQSIVLCQNNQSTVIPCSSDKGIAFVQALNQFARIQRIVYPSGQAFAILEDPTAEIKGTVMILDRQAQAIVWIPEELQDSIFTKMFFFNGAGLKNFELVGNWGNEVKLYRIKD